MNIEYRLAEAEALCLRHSIHRAKRDHRRHSHLWRKLSLVVARMAAMGAS